MPERGNIMDQVAHVSITTRVLSGLFVALIIAGGVGSWYGYSRYKALSDKVVALEGKFASSTEGLKADITETDIALNSALENQGKSVGALQQEVGGFQAQVGTLAKLSQIDPQLLAKYSKVYFLNENYVPAQLADIPSEYAYVDSQKFQLIPQVLLKIESMMAAAKKDGIDLYIVSAYRSFAEQKNLKSSYTFTYGAGTANSFSADQGYSEHQLGTTVDFITKGLGGQLTDAFDQTSAFTWLQDNAYKYGFEMSYPKGNSYYTYEPWHWRYVGVKLTTDLHSAGKNFYDLDQRTINAYLISLFD